MGTTNRREFLASTLTSVAGFASCRSHRALRSWRIRWVHSRLRRHGGFLHGSISLSSGRSIADFLQRLTRDRHAKNHPLYRVRMMEVHPESFTRSCPRADSGVTKANILDLFLR